MAGIRVEEAFCGVEETDGEIIDGFFVCSQAEKIYFRVGIIKHEKPIPTEDFFKKVKEDTNVYFGLHLEGFNRVVEEDHLNGLKKFVKVRCDFIPILNISRVIKLDQR